MRGEAVRVRARGAFGVGDQVDLAVGLLEGLGDLARLEEGAPGDDVVRFVVDGVPQLDVILFGIEGDRHSAGVDQLTLEPRDRALVRTVLQRAWVRCSRSSRSRCDGSSFSMSLAVVFRSFSSSAWSSLTTLGTVFRTLPSALRQVSVVRVPVTRSSPT